MTIFVSTHFMNEAERCDRISLMHCGHGARGPAPPVRCVKARGVATLGTRSSAYLEEAMQAPTLRRRTIAVAPAKG